MSVQIWNNVLVKQHNNLCWHAKINYKFLSICTKLCAKKQFRMKNKFTFQDKLKAIAKVDSKIRDVSSEVFSEQNTYDKESDNPNLKDRGFVSADLLSRKENRIHQKITLPQKAKTRKQSLTYQGEILFGVHPVYLTLLKNKRIFHHLYTREDIDSLFEDDFSRKKEIINLAKSMNIPISFVDSRGLKILAPGAVHQGICLDAGFLPLSNWNEDQSEIPTYTSENKALWLVLDEILDPMNVGAIIRSAYYFGVDKLFTVKGNSCKLSPVVSKASSGTLEVMDIYQIGNLEEFVRKRKDNGWCIVSTLAYSNQLEFTTTPVSADQFSISKPTIIILGNEGKGISQDILNLCDSLISIEPGQILTKGIDSLNVSVAAGVLLYVLNSSRNVKR